MKVKIKAAVKKSVLYRILLYKKKKRNICGETRIGVMYYLATRATSSRFSVRFQEVRLKNSFPPPKKNK